MSSYTVRPGDTFERIARSQLGTEESAELIRSANPGAGATPAPGTALFIPKPEVPQPPPGVGLDQVTVLVDGRPFVGWEEVTFTRAMDRFGTFDLFSMWDPENAEFRDVFRPLQFQSVSIFIGAELLFNGTMVNVSPADEIPRTVSASGYSRPGVLNDCTAPVSALPLERDDQNLRELAAALAEPFGVPVEFSDDPGAAFERESPEPTEKLLSYFIKLAQQRNFIVSDTPAGACLFQREAQAGEPAAVMTAGADGFTRLTAQFNPQDYYSHISGQHFTAFGAVGSEPGSVYTVRNSHLPDVLRPLTFAAPDTQTGDLTDAVDAKIGRMLANAASYRMEVPSWRTPDGALWRPNTTVTVSAPGAMVYRSTEFLIREVTYRRDATQETAELLLALPGSFRGELPEVLPWED